MYAERRRWSDRVKTVSLPLFSSYVFCRFPYADRLKVLGTPSVLSLVSFGGKPSPLREEEIERIRAMVGSGLPVAPWNYVAAGDHVRVSHGAMSGLEGILVTDKSRLRVVVNVDLLGRAVAMEIDRDCVIPVARHAGRGLPPANTIA
jgi:transcription antitermination factor NusG